jgi:DNA-binding response OmpR family regulator
MAKTILLADDSPTIRKIVELTFSDSEIRVESVTEAAAVLDQLEGSGADLVLADVALPGPSGYELCRTIKDSERPVPVVLLAGTFEPLDPELARDCGADGHLIKPFESQTLRDKVEELLRSRPEPQGEAEPAPQPEPTDSVKVDAEPAEPSPAAQSEFLTDEPEPPGVATDEQTATQELIHPSAELVEAVARAVIERLSDRVVREIAWEVVPDLAAAIIRERIRELEKED